MKKFAFLLLACAFLLAACKPASTSAPAPLSPVPSDTATKTPTSTPTAMPSATPASIETNINGEDYTVTGYEARYGSGVLAYVKDIYGNWIKTSYEAPSPSDSGLLDRLGSNYVFNSDNTGITGIDGLQLDINKNTATLNIDGRGEETFSTADIHVITKDINGNSINPTLVAMGYAYNPETKTWEVYNPGFPMDSPKDELAWFNQADISNGNWLRWHQRVIEGLAKQNNEDAATYLKNLFADAVTPSYWATDKRAKNFNKEGAVDEIYLGWYVSDANFAKNSLDKGTAKEQNPQRGGLSFAYLVDNDGVLISLDAENPDGTTIRSLPLYFDAMLWSKLRNSGYFTRVAFAADRPFDSTSMTPDKTFADTNSPGRWFFDLVVSYLPDATITPVSPGTFNTKDLILGQDPQSSTLREAAISTGSIDKFASLVPWPGIISITSK